MVADIVYLGPCDKYPSARRQKLCCFAQECPYSQHRREFPNILLPNSCSREGTTTLKLALRRVDARFNAAEVEHIELKRYPWFFIAKVRVHPYQTQQGAVLLIGDKAVSPPMPFPAGVVVCTGNHIVSAVS